MDEIYDTIKERIKHNIVGNFLFFFAIKNWQAFVHLTTGEDSSSARVGNIENHFILLGWESLWMPLLFTVLSVIILPWISFGVEYYKAWIENKKSSSLEKQKLVFDTTSSYKLDLAKTISGKCILLANSMIQNNQNNPEALRRITSMLQVITSDAKLPIQEGFNQLLQTEKF